MKAKDAKISYEVPLAHELAEALLKPHETIRDSVQGDIVITALERHIIDTSAFQRLRFLLQLGPTHLVYPGAVHTRFAHSIGTLHWADKLAQIVNRNYAVYSQRSLVEIDPYPHFLIRLCALLHDVAHIPFGHTLEDEGNLSEPEWDDNARAEYWLGAKSEIVAAITNFLAANEVPEDKISRIIADIRRYIHHKGDLMELEFPFISDIVGNTLCADLLDYLDRDMYYCGLKERSGDRVVKYFAVVRVKRRPSQVEEEDNLGDHKIGQQVFIPVDNPGDGKGRMVLLAYRWEQEHFPTRNLKLVKKPEILSEAIDLLRRRFALAEKVYFHRSKLAASAMLISAMNSSSIKIPDIYEISDDSFIRKLESDANGRTRHLVKAYTSRNLYKPVYELDYLEECDTDAQSTKLWKESYPSFRLPEWRRKHEEFIEINFGLAAGSIAIYCPDRSMNLKEFEMLVQIRPEQEIKILENILERNRKSEMDAINQRLIKLWKFLILADPNEIDVTQYANERVHNLSAFCEGLIKIDNGIEELTRRGKPLREQFATRVVQEWENEPGNTQVPFDMYEQMIEASYKSEDQNILESMRKHLAALMTTATNKEGQLLLKPERPLK